MSTEGTSAMGEENKEKSALVPRLRFPEFRGAGKWEKKTLADVCLKITNGKANAEDHEDGGIYPLYDRSEVVKKSSEYVFDDEAVIIPGEGMRFQPKYYKGKFNLHQRAYALMQHQGNAEFVYYTLDRFKDTLAKNAVKSTVLSLRLPIIERFSLAVPDKNEQQKIADCLSSLDDLITAETQKLDALKTHKKGLMQQLFPREGETVPRLRFPMFRDAGEWVEIPLEEIGEIVTGKTPSTSDDSLWNGDIQFVTPTDISEEKYQWKTQRSVTGNAKTKALPLHSIMFTCIASIGKIALSVKPCITNQQINTLIPNKGHENEFVYYSLLNIVPLIKSTQANSTLPIINKTEFSKFTVPVPNVRDEQKRVADFLSSLDDLITAQNQKIDALKTHKKGLMQQLFPVLDEVQA